MGKNLAGKHTLLKVKISLRFGSLLYPMSGLSWKIFCSSSLFSIMFQLSQIICVMFGFLGLCGY